MKKYNPYDQRYAGEEFYWGKEPSAMCDRVIEIIKPSADFHPKLLDLGCGEGRDAVYFAKHGFDVFGVDVSLPGLEKTRKYAEEVGVYVETIHANIVDYELEDTYDVIFSTGTLHYLPRKVRRQCFQKYKDCTPPAGINAFSLFVEKPFIPRAPDAENLHHASYRSGELMGYYWDWEILYCTEEIWDCMSGGISHKHTSNRMIAKRG
ncbi:class I SAM-dependent methyltransferase [Chloroflexota bacterium]